MTQRSAAGTGLAVATVFTFLLAGGAAHATTMLKLGLESLVANADRVVKAEVQSIESLRQEGQIVTDIELRVLEQWKGPSDGASKLTVRKAGGRIGDTVTRVHGMPRFREGEHAVLFLNRSSDGKFHTVTGLRQGKFHVAVGPDGSTKYVVPRLDGVQLLEPEDGSSAKIPSASDPMDVSDLQSADPAPIHRQVTPLEDFRERVRAAASDGEDEQ